MGRLVKRRWTPDPSLPMDGRLGAPFDYEAYVPDEIADTDPVLSASLARVLHEADEAVRELNDSLPSVTGLEALSRQLLRQESVASSRIEGLVISHRRLARAAVAEDDQHRDSGAEAILANIAAMEFAIAHTSTLPAIAAHDIVAVHRRLMEQTRDAHLAGLVRASQNWIGANNHNPRGAAFVPPPETEVRRLLDDLAAFMNRRDLPPTLQAAIAHAQFETIHPFPDGNGRTGRCLIHVCYRRAALAPRFVPPVSLLLATDGDAYVRGLTAYRTERPENWYLDFATTVIRASRAARSLGQQIEELEERWLAQAGNPRRGSTARRLIEALPAQPILRIGHVVAMTGAKSSAAQAAVNQLRAAGVLKQITVGRRNRAFEAVGLLNLVDTFERRLAVPEPDGNKPVRPAPFLN
ncbi:MAG TPA: Fic family protein [Solirubrobacteraceae bacterium]|nr:Fic family protein [Solirubrobacteraceae bacterium]